MTSNTPNRIKNWTGTVHFAAAGLPACGPVKTHASYLRATVETVNCERCIARFGEDTPTGLLDTPAVEEHVARRAAERAARRAARTI